MGAHANSRHLMNVDIDVENDHKVVTSKQALSLAIGQQVRLIRKARSMTGKELGEKLNVSQQQISRYERGICHIDVDTLIHLLHVLDTSIDRFFANVSFVLSEQSPQTYSKYHSLFFPVIDVPNEDYILMKSVGDFI